MDAQTRVRDTAALAALVQCLVRREALERTDDQEPLAPEVIEENRFLASRDGMDAKFVDVGAGCCVPVADNLAVALHTCAPHARRLRCERELASVSALADRPGALRQRAAARQKDGLQGVLRTMHGDFVSARAEPAVVV
jgi:carboxylate-amine ligase